MEENTKDSKDEQANEDNQGEEWNSFVTDIGLTKERIRELTDITSSLVARSANDSGSGRVSHIILGIVGRKDLSEMEKVVCVYLFTNIVKLYDPKKSKYGVGRSTMGPYRGSLMHKTDMPKIIDINIKNPRRELSGIMISPTSMEPPEMLIALMATLVSILRTLPKPVVQEFCRIVSQEFDRIATSGDI